MDSVLGLGSRDPGMILSSAKIFAIHSTLVGFR